ncbi:cytochrome P450 [Nemania serpens]|nr:cytochrome P450 [Nemania serpens]
MSPGFLNGVVAPGIHTATLGLLELWQLKSRLAGSRSFDADADIIRAVVDVVLLVSYGFDVGTIRTQMEEISSRAADVVGSTPDDDTPVEFPSAEDPTAYGAMRNLVDSIQIGMSSPFPRQHLTFALNYYPSLVSARKFVDNLLTERLKATYKKFSDDGNYEQTIGSAMDVIVSAEVAKAKEDGHQPMYDTPAIRDELVGFFTAGHETTSTTLRWCVKQLTRHQTVQHRLRKALRLAHHRAAEAGTLPSPDYIAKTTVPYLDAFIEENHRVAAAIPTVIRMATRDTVVLGHKIPKGTDVFMPVNGPSYVSPSFPINEYERSLSSQAAKDRYGEWDHKDMAEFKPERFLVTSGDGTGSFNPKAGPILPYGAGLRGCFGVKMAKLELRVIITMILWTFKLLPLPPEVSNFGGEDVNTHRPQQTYLRLERVT